MASTSCVPGQILSTTQHHLPGPGTHIHDNSILASIIGTSLIRPAQSKSSKPTISVPRQATSTTNTSSLPKVRSHVLCRVTRVRQRELNASILTVVTPSASPPSPGSIIPYTHITTEDLQFQAILRKEDIRTHADANTTITQSYRVGDIVLAQVISLGDERNYYVSTAGNEFGVVVATSEAGNAMVPVSWREMRDVVTGIGETRKVAKPS
ncbi:exosome 3'-_5 exonuclease subunit ski4 (Csl4) [Cladophialophora chaetospira]|uniref:Exosome 3'->5 exonuclease subunit ski4 (Csl4) n=1 Tax=Cladophialophora chaetospira TaxID=386627 RepID=A0AA38XHJ6_9EURO|nr:exosome 3'->5 exonuclease subunit ski4 (Csl4) [Cladophialophora chaetospira]